MRRPGRDREDGNGFTVGVLIVTAVLVLAPVLTFFSGPPLSDIDDGSLDTPVSTNEVKGGDPSSRSSGRADPVETLSYDMRYKDPAPVAYGGYDEDWTGWKMAAGDLNGDGYDDWAISSPWNDGKGLQYDDAGRVHIIFGAPRPTLQVSDRRFDLLTEDVTLYGLDPGDSFGFSLASGDFNADGYDDLAVGAPWADGPGDDAEASGDVYIFYGREAWPDSLELNDDYDLSDANVSITGGPAGEWFGYCLDTGEVDSDGRDELLIGAPRADGTGVKLKAGKAFLASGLQINTSSSLWNLSLVQPLFTLEGKDFNDYYGTGVMMADWDGQGHDEMFVGAVQGKGGGDPRTNSGEIAVVRLPDAYIPPVYQDLAADGPETWIYGPDSGDGIGRRMTTGDVNGDLIEDFIVGVPYADGHDNLGNETGEVHLIFGSSDIYGAYGSGTEEFDLRTDADVTWYGITDYDRAGYSQECVDLDGDGKGEILVGSQGGNGPLNKRLNSGEVYVVSGKYAEVGDGWGITGGSLAEYTVIYGVDEGDELGTDVTSGDLDNDGYPEIIMSARGAAGHGGGLTEAGECYVLFSFPQPVVLNGFRIVDGATPVDGEPSHAGKVCLAGLRDYTFTLEATNPVGASDVRSVNISLDPDVGRQNLQISWDRTDGFAEVWDPEDLLTLNTMGSSVEEKADGRFLAHFNIAFSWDFPTERLLGARVKVDCVEAMSRNNTFRNVFRVENDLNMTGDLGVKAGGATLTDGDWVASSTVLHWSGIKVHYQQNPSISPPDGSFSLRISDDDGDTWVQTDASALGLDLDTTADPETDGADMHVIEVVDVDGSDLPGGPDIPAPLNFTVRVDADPPGGARNITFVGDPSGSVEEGDLYDDDKTFTFHWDPAPDNGSGTAGYHYSLEYNGGAANGIGTNATNGGFSNAPEGPNPVYIWSYDAVGNMEGPQEGVILLDFKPLSAPGTTTATDVNGVTTSPGENRTFNTTTFTFRAAFTDPDSGGAESGVDISTVQYAIIESGESSPEEWLSEGIMVDGLDPMTSGNNEFLSALSSKQLTVGQKEAFTGVNTTGLGFSVNLTLPEGTSTVVWRAADIAGGVPVMSSGLDITVSTSVPVPNGPPVPVIASPTADGVYLTRSLVVLSSEGTADPDADILTYSWNSSIDGHLLDGEGGSMNLSAGGHTITLTVDDGHGHSVTATVDITVMLDTDGDGTPDETDTDDDGDGVPDAIDDDPTDPTIGDLDGGGEDGEDGDDDEDGAGGLALMAVVIIVIIVMAAAAGAFVLRSRRMRAAEEEEAGGGPAQSVEAEVELTPGWGISSTSEVDLLTGDAIDTAGVTAGAGTGTPGQALPATTVPASGDPSSGPASGTPGDTGPSAAPGGTSLGGADTGAPALAGATGEGTPLLPKPRGVDPENPLTPGEPAYQDAPAESPYEQK